VLLLDAHYTSPRPVFEEGTLLLVDKPLTWTSFDVVAKLRGITRCRKIGHAGTLDPMATGLLLLCTGKATKQIETLQGQAKTYEATLQLGAVTASYDAEADPIDLKPFAHLAAQDLEQALVAFRGEIMQRPPLFSAVKVDGQRAYKLARRGEDTELPARPVTIYALELLGYDVASGRALLRVECSKGTYIRSLAHDIGQVLGCGAYLAGLVRTQIGPYRLVDALTPAQWAERLRPAVQ